MHFIYSSVHLLIPYSQFIPPHFPFGSHKFVFYDNDAYPILIWCYMIRCIIFLTFWLYSLFQKLFICWPINMWHLLKDKLRLDHKSMTWESYLTLWVHFWAFIHRMLDDIAEYEFISMEQADGCVNFAISAKVIWKKKHSGFPLGKNLNCFSTFDNE